MNKHDLLFFLTNSINPSNLLLNNYYKFYKYLNFNILFNNNTFYD